MDKDVLMQYGAIKGEIKGIRRQIAQIDRLLNRVPVVSDTVHGSRQDLTIGSIKITGTPDPEYSKKMKARKQRLEMLEKEELRLEEQACQCEKYIEGLEDPEIRDILRCSIIDSMTNVQIARYMNTKHPNRKIKYTDENIKKKIQRFFKMSPNVPENNANL